MRLLKIGLAVASICVSLPSQGYGAVFYPENYTLANGLRVVIVQNKLSPAVAQMVWYKVGSVDDPRGLSGMAHYLEHMMFKGTADVPSGAFSALIAGMGGDDNAFTTHDTTAYHEIVAAENLGAVMALEADRMRSLQIDPKQALPERDVVLSERQQRTDNSPQGLFAEKMAATLFPNHPYGRPVIGWAGDIARFSPEETRAFYRAHYAPNNALLIVSGNVETADVLRLADATFGRLAASKDVPLRPDLGKVSPPSQPRVEMKDTRVRQPFVVQRYIVSSRRADPPLSYALEVLSEVLGADEVGLLYRHFVMDRKLAAGINASYDPISLGPSVFAFGATPAPGQDIRRVEKEMKAYLRKLARRGIDAKAVRAAQQRLEDSAVFARDRIMAPAEILGASVATGLSVNEVERWPHRIRAVTPDQVNAALRALLANPYHVTGILEGAP